jgi:Fur family zinc uptake transcriptional regulator
MYSAEMADSSRSKTGTHKQQILALLRRSRQPMTAYALLDKLRGEGVKAPTTVYRALSALAQQGLIHRIESLNAYVACQHQVVDDHAHGGQFAICTSCGTVQELELESVAAPLGKIGRKFLASVQHRVVEFTGICHGCQAKVS